MAASQELPKTSKGWHRHVWHLSWPIILANITIPLVGVADVWVMGRLNDPIYIAAVALGATWFSAVYWMLGFLRMGTTGLMAQAYGQLSQARTDQTELYAIFIRAGAIASVLGATLVALQLPLTNLFTWIFRPDLELRNLTEQYYQLRIWGAPGYLIHMVELGVLFGLQRMRETLYLSIGLNVSNLVLDLLFVLGFGMGVEGVALGTLISEWGAAAFGFWLVLRALPGNWPINIPHLWLKEKLAALFSLSGNLVLRTFFVQLPFLAGTQLATGLGQTTLAAHAILMQMFFVMTYSLDAFAHTAETLTGYTFGAKKPVELRQASFYSSLWAFGFAALTALSFYLFGPAIVHFFTVSEEVSEFAIGYLPWLVLAPFFCTWAFLLDGIFIGTTFIRAMRNAMIGSALIWALVLALSFESMQYHAVWMAMCVFMAARGVLLGLAYPSIERAAVSET